MPALSRHLSCGVTLLADASVAGGVTLAFTERTGGVSEAPFASLNLGSRCGDDPSRVAENRRRALAAIGAEDLADRLVVPRQVHGERVVTVRSADPAELAASRAEAEAGADAVVVTAPDVPALLCFADCVPVIIAAPGGFAVAHSGWRGTLARIARSAVRALMAETGASADELVAYVGPHILAEDYEVSEDLAARFSEAFGPGAVPSRRHLDLTFCVTRALEEAGLAPSQVWACDVSTARATDRFFSYRAEGGQCGRHAAVAVLRSRPWSWPAGTRALEGGSR